MIYKIERKENEIDFFDLYGKKIPELEAETLKALLYFQLFPEKNIKKSGTPTFISDPKI